MAKFIIYLELTKADSHEYDNFNELLESKNILKKIQDEESLRWYYLPNNFYYYKGEINDREIIYDNVSQSVNDLGLEIFGIVVITALGVTWEGLSLHFF